MSAIHSTKTVFSAGSMAMRQGCHPERSWNREAIPTQSKDPEQACVNADVSGGSVWDFGQNTLERGSGERVRGVLRLRSRCASRTRYFAQDDTEGLAKRVGYFAQDDTEGLAKRTRYSALD